MNIKMTLSDTANRVRGAAQISLDWEKRIWSVDQDPHGVWRNLSTFRTGKFELSGGVMRLVDEAQQSAVRLFDSPRAVFDLSGAKGGSGTISKPVDPSLSNAKVDWKIEGSAGGAAAAVPTSFGIREKLIARLRQLLPCSIDGKEKDPLTGQKSWDVVSVNCKRFSGTSCGSLPGFVTQYLGADPLKNGRSSGIAAGKAYMAARSLNGTKRIREQGLKYGAWVEADGVKRPKKGDIYGLLDRDKAGMPLLDKKNDYIGHVGVILDSSGPIWKTADLGQGTGFDGKFDVPRPYDAQLGQLWGESIHPGVSLFRTLAGWVDIDAYFSA